MAQGSVHPPAPTASVALTGSRNDGDVDVDVWRVVAWLDAERANHDLTGWVKTQGGSWKSLWNACPRGDWLLAIACRTETPPVDLRRATSEVAAMIQEDLEAPGLAEAVATLRLGVATGELPSGFVDESDRIADAAADLAESLAWRVVTLAGRSFSDPEIAALVPAQVAELAMASVLDCAMMSALGATQARTADIIRSVLARPMLRPR